MANIKVLPSLLPSCFKIDPIYFLKGTVKGTQKWLLSSFTHFYVSPKVLFFIVLFFCGTETFWIIHFGFRTKWPVFFIWFYLNNFQQHGIVKSHNLIKVNDWETWMFHWNLFSIWKTGTGKMYPMSVLVLKVGYMISGSQCWYLKSPKQTRPYPKRVSSLFW